MIYRTFGGILIVVSIIISARWKFGLTKSYYTDKSEESDQDQVMNAHVNS